MPELSDYFKPDGVWDPSLAQTLEDAIERGPASYLSDPWSALKPFYDQPTWKLLKDRGAKWADLQSHARNSLDAILQEELAQQRIIAYEAAVVRLVLESLLRRVDLLSVADLPQYERWLASMDPRRPGASSPNFAAIKSLSPRALLKLAVHAPALRLDKNAAIARSVSTVVEGALAREQSTGSVGIGAKVRIAALRVWVVNREDSEADVRSFLRVSGFSAGQLESLENELRAERGAERLAADLEPGIGLEQICGNELFLASAEWYGFRIDPASYELLRTIGIAHARSTDPWVRRLLAEAMGNADRAKEAIAAIGQQQLERVDRPFAFDFFAQRAWLSAPEIGVILQSELSSHGGHVAQRLFLALAEQMFLNNAESVARCIDAAGLQHWFDQSWDAYRRDAQRGRVKEFDDEVLARLVRSVAGWRTLPPLGQFAQEIEAQADKIAERLDRAAARKEGREWLYDFILTCIGRMPEQFDARAGILLSEDQGKIARMLDARQRPSAQWWAQPFESAFQEMRLREAAARNSGQSDEGLEYIASENAESMRRACGGAPADLLEAELNRCQDAIVHGTDSARPQLLAAFRSGDKARFREQLDPVLAELPPVRRHRSLFGKRFATVAAIVLAVPAMLLWRVWFGTSAPADSAERAEAVEEPIATGYGDPVEPVHLGWSAMAGQAGKRWKRALSAEEVRVFFGREVEMSAWGNRSAKGVSLDIAQEFVRRYERWLQAHYPGGVMLAMEPAPWTAFTVRLPRKEELDADGAGSSREIWLESGEVWDAKTGRTFEVPSRDREATIDVVIERRD